MADLIQATLFVFLVLTLHRLIGSFNEAVSRAMVVFVSISSAIMCLNNVFALVALKVASENSFADAFGTSGSHGMVLTLLELHHYGILVAQIFFGLWLAPLGYLAQKSGMFPKVLGSVLKVAAVSYIFDTFLMFATPEFGVKANPILIIVPIIGELWMVGYLLFLGLNRRTLKSSMDILDAAPAVLLEKVGKETVDKTKAVLEAAGATVSVK